MRLRLRLRVRVSVVRTCGVAQHGEASVKGVACVVKGCSK